MIYDDNHEPETGGSNEIFGSWLFIGAGNRA
jgi:hypothetical protein